MRIAALDYGERRIGLAVSDELGLTAQGVMVYHRVGRRADLAFLAGKVKELAAERIVMGLPLTLKGEQGPAAQKAHSFGRALGQAAGLPVVFADERLTTAAATKELIAMDRSRRQRRQVIDQTAAILILQGYLDRESRRPASEADEREE